MLTINCLTLLLTLLNRRQQIEQKKKTRKNDENIYNM